MTIEAKSYRAAMEVTFTFPATIQEETGYKSVTIRELSKSAETKALARAGLDGAVLMQELSAESLVRAVKVDGTVQEISTADDSIDVFMSAVGSKGRALVGAAYGKVNQPNKDEATSFLGSASAKVG